MIVWVDADRAPEHNCQIGSGGRYNPQTDTWLPTSHPGTARINHTAIWTGAEMIIWGGCAFTNNVLPAYRGRQQRPALRSSDRHLAADEHRECTRAATTSTLRFGPALKWSFGEAETTVCEPVFNTGGRYNPATDTWAADESNRGSDAAL